MTTATHTEHDIHQAIRELHHAIRVKDRHELEELHDPEFQGAELPGKLITAEEHIVTAMNGRDLELTFYDVKVRLYGDIALTWARQTLKGELDPDDPGTSPQMAADVADGLWFSFLTVWRFTNGRWRMLSYQCTQLTDPTLQQGEPFVI